MVVAARWTETDVASEPTTHSESTTPLSNQYGGANGSTVNGATASSWPAGSAA
jgi:hypothetical protein